jgi:hypothetical protein
MVKGGYQIINLEGHPHTSGVGAVHEGIYEKIEGTSKPILLSGIVVNATEYHDTYIFPCVNGSNYVAVVGENPTTNQRIVIDIQDNDVVTFTISTSPN